MSQSIQPLRIQKNTPTSSPSKIGGSQTHRVLAELSPMERRRNSPSFVQNSKKTSYVEESSPFDSSPFASSSPRLYWQNRDPASPSRFNRENRGSTDQRDSSPSPAKRSSIENLKRASRVKNSNMFAREHKHEYDPSSSPLIERPLATGRPLSVQTQGNAFGGKGLDGLRKENLLENSKIPVYSPPRSPTKFNGTAISNTPSKSQLSPGKSSLSSKSKYPQAPIRELENGHFSEEEEDDGDHELPPGKSLHRHAKSVTFDAAPPQINEYEMTTPDPSSVYSGSREGSYESVENEEGDSFDCGSSIEREDSFDESLEDTDKTPVVLPEDWRFMSPAIALGDLAAYMENPFTENESSPAPTARPSSAVDARLSPTRTDSANSNGERRPLPPLPALGMPILPRAPSPQPSQARISDLDPDTPIPSMEAESTWDQDEASVFIKQEDDGEGTDEEPRAPSPQSSQTRISDLDPDTLIPSMEAEPTLDQDEASVFIKQEDDGEGMDEEPRTPDSVIRHFVASSPLPESPSVPEPIATIKAPGAKLKTRPSITPADIRTMAETRRQVSQEIPIVPPIPEKHQNRPSVILESTTSTLDPEAQANPEEETADKDSCKHTKRKSSLVQLEIPIGRSDDGLGFGLDQEFDRVIEAQKVAFNFSSPSLGPQPKSSGHAEYIAGQGFRPVSLNSANRTTRTQKGYLMRQNTKIIIASSASHESATDMNEPGARGTRSAGNSPRKPSQQHPWTTEPWNGKMRRKSLRQSGGSPQKKPALGPAPPLPGQQSNVANGLGSVTEDEVTSNSEEIDDNGERGILFVKVVSVKDLDLPLPKGERSYFALTLDNGLHCVTTAWLELGTTAPIGQEFELIVLDDLEFQLTLQTKLEEPKVKPIIESPTKEVKLPKQSTFSRVFGSPRKRKELEMKQQEEAQKAERQRQQDAQASRRSVQPTAWDLLHGLVAKDGSFARSYVCLKDHESKVYGKPLTVDVPCFNEWATEEAQTTSSVKSKRNNARPGTQRKAPYKIGKLELQLLFIPRPKGSKSEDMPKSMNACIRELKDAEAATTKKWEGHLSQQGGDCPYWRRRFFTLEGSKFTAHHEATRQPRATIHLAGASKLIDDRSALMQKETSGKGGGRRKSAFAEEEEGYMFVEEGFRIRFANGETIDFYADSAAEKDGWMKALAEVVGKDSVKGKAWTDLVLAKHRAIASKAASAAHAHMKAPPPSSAPQPPPNQNPPQNSAPFPAEREFRHSATGGRRTEAAKTRSMIF